MGYVHADIELINQHDMHDAKRNIIGQEEIRRLRARALVDTGSYYLCINENMQEILQLPVLERRRLRLANDHTEDYDIVGPVELRFANRRNTCEAVILPGSSEVLLGSIPLEGMDVLIDPLRQELIVNPVHPDMAEARL